MGRDPCFSSFAHCYIPRASALMPFHCSYSAHAYPTASILPPSNLTILGSAFLFYSLFHSLHHVSLPLGISHCPQENIAPQIEHDSPAVL